MHSIPAFHIGLHPTSEQIVPMSIAMPDEQPSHDQEEDSACLTYEEASMQQSTHFLHSLQELKNLRPQLYSAAEYCELSYVNNRHKQIVVENLKDYIVKALINTVDHLGSVSYKLNDLLSNQINDISSTQLRITCLNQRLLKCQEYTDREGLMQQCLVERSPRYHKHYILPRSVIEESEASAEKLMENDQYEQTTPSGVYPEIRGVTKANSTASFRDDFALMPSATGPGSFFFLDTEVPIPSVSSQYSRVHSTRLSPGLTTSNSFAAGRRQESSKIFKSPSVRLPFGDSHRLDICKPPARSKSLLSFLLNKRKAGKQHVSRAS